MTKSEEIKILSAAAKKLGNDSYLGDALLHLIPHLEMSIRSDICPNLLELVKDLEARAVAADKRYADLSLKNKELEKGFNDLADAVARAEERRDDLEAEIEKAKWKAVDAIAHLKGLIPESLTSLGV